MAAASKDVPVVVFGQVTNLAALQFLALLVPIAACFTVVRNVSTTQFTKCVGSAQSGTIIGLDMGIGSAVRIVSPLVGGVLVSSDGLASVAATCAGLCVTMAAISAALMGGDITKGKRRKVA